MKISVNYLKQIIKEEVERTLEEDTVEEGEENLEEETLEEVDARDLAKGSLAVKKAREAGKERGPGGEKAANQKLVKTKNQYNTERGYDDKARAMVAKRTK